jgi:hypothetical protein
LPLGSLTDGFLEDLAPDWREEDLCLRLGLCLPLDFGCRAVVVEDFCSVLLGLVCLGVVEVELLLVVVELELEPELEAEVEVEVELELEVLELELLEELDDELGLLEVVVVLLGGAAAVVVLLDVAELGGQD